MPKKVAKESSEESSNESNEEVPQNEVSEAEESEEEETVEEGNATRLSPTVVPIIPTSPAIVTLPVRTAPPLQTEILPVSTGLPENARIEILNLPLEYCDETELKTIFKVHGTVHSITFTTTQSSVHGFVQFETRDEMEKGMGEDRREMPQGFKMDLADEFKRNLERDKMKTLRSIDPKPQPVGGKTKRSFNEDKRSSNNNRNSSNKRRDGSRERSTERRDSRTYSNDRNDRSYSNSDRDSDQRPRKRSLSPVSKSNGPADILIIGLGDVLNTFVESLEAKCKELRMAVEVSFLDYKDDVKGKIARFKTDMNALGVLFCERKREESRNVSLQIFSATDFENLSQSEAFAIISRERQARAALPQNPLLMALAQNPMNPLLLQLANAVPGYQAQLPQGYQQPGYQQQYFPPQLSAQPQTFPAYQQGSQGYQQPSGTTYQQPSNSNYPQSSTSAYPQPAAAQYQQNFAAPYQQSYPAQQQAFPSQPYQQQQQQQYVQSLQQPQNVSTMLSQLTANKSILETLLKNQTR